MNNRRKSRLIAVLAIAALTIGAGQMCGAQESSKGAVIVYPIVYSRNSGTETSRKTGVEVVKEVLQKAGYTLVSSNVGANVWRRLGIMMPVTDRPATLADLVRFGKAVKARYVVSPVFDFNSRSIWVDLGPKTVSTATIDIRITDVQEGQTVYAKEDVTGRSDEKFDLLLSGADIISPLFTIVSGGPKTPHEQRAVQIAVSKAMRGWIHPNE